MAATYEPIATTTLGSAAASITFSSIPSTYTDLRLVLVGKVAATNANIIYTVNGSTTTYSQTNLYGDGSTVTSDRLSNFDGWYPTQADLGSTTIPSFYTLDIFSYTGSTNKTALITNSVDQNGSGQVGRVVSLWRNTAAITPIALSDSSNFAIGTTATLYGIKAA